MPSFFVFKLGGAPVKEPDLYEMIKAQAKRDNPPPKRSQLPAYLRGEIRERTKTPQPTYRDTTANTAVARASKKKKENQ